MHYAIAFVVALLWAPSQAKEYHEFEYWSGHKVGSSVTFKIDMEAQGQKFLIEITRTMLESGADKIVVESKTKLTLAGQEQPGNTEKEDILKDKDKDPIKVEKEGDEEIEVAGKKMKCHWIEGTQKEGKVKFWVTKEVPGGVVKAEMSPMAGLVIKVEATGWEKK